MKIRKHVCVSHILGRDLHGVGRFPARNGEYVVGAAPGDFVPSFFVETAHLGRGVDETKLFLKFD